MYLYCVKFFIMDLKTRFKRSFATKLTILVLFITSFVFIITISIIYQTSRSTIAENINDNSSLAMKNSVYEIEKKFESIAKTVDNIALIVEQETLPLDTLYSIVKYVVARNVDIVGSAIAFEPYYNANKDYFFSPYAYRSDNKIYTKQLGNYSYDYFEMDWYSKPKKTNSGVWSSPYYDAGGGYYLMCTYSAPMYNRNGRFIGVVTADISLVQVSQLMNDLKPTEESYSFAVYKDGSYYNKGHFYNSPNYSFHTAKDIIKDKNTRELVANDMIQAKTGSYDIDKNLNTGKKVYYTPISNTGWTLGLVVNKDYLYKDLQDATSTILIVALIGFLLIFFTCRHLIHTKIRPLTIFANAAKEIAKGKFDVKLPKVKSKDEMLELYDSFKYLKEELVNSMNSLAQTISANEKIESELNVARSIQMGLIPKSFPPFPKRKDIDLVAFLHPAKEVGGDLYDFFIDHKKLYFCIGDVSDKGIPAAIFMALTRAQFRSFASGSEDAKVIVEGMNKSISESNDANMFVTLIVGILDMETGVIQYCNAGHNNPCLIDVDGKARFIEIFPSLPIGIISEAQYKNEYLTLSANQTLFLYTDGVNEAENSVKEQFGNDRLIDVLSQDHCPSPDEEVTNLKSAIKEFVNGSRQSDDITMLAIKYFGALDEKFILLKNHIAEINRMNQWFDEILDVDDNTRMQINLAMEEVVTNVILYAYPTDGKEYQFAIHYSKHGNELCFVIEDNGIAFDPTAKEDADITLSAEDRPIGGLGIFLVKQLMDSVEYQRKDDCNLLTIKKIINS